ncbi:MAG: hypothetical protein ACRDHZ_20225 [Ktedonobacteraceae bacterium]
MKRELKRILTFGLLVVAFFMLTALLRAQQTKQRLTITDVMTPQELNDSGVSALTASQREALNGWLNRYTETVIKFALSQENQNTSHKTKQSDCDPTVESTIAGDFNGWEADTIFKLDDGEIWEQSEYDYYYSYSYRPDVTIYQTSAGCKMKVSDEDQTILVRRIK